MRIRRVRGIPLTWQDVRHQEKVIDQRAPRLTVLHVVAARDMGTATVADTQPLPIRPLLTPPRGAAEAVGAAVAGPAV